MSGPQPPQQRAQSDDSPRAAAARLPVPGKWRAVLIYAALTLVLMHPISTNPGGVVAGNGPDMQLGLWVLSWDVHAFTHQPLSIFDANVFHPQPRTLAYQDNLIGSAFFAAPVIWLTGNPVLALNLICVLATILCGLGGYVLARRLGLSEPAALLCGLMFGFCPPRFFRYSQVGLAPVQWIPLALASLHAYLDGGRKRDLRIAAGLVTLQTLTSSHAAVFLVVGIVVVLASRVLLGEPLRAVQRLRDLGLTGLLLFVPAVLSYLPYRLNQREFGLRRDLSDWTRMYGDFLASPTYVHAKLLSVFGLARINDEASGFLFPGYVPVILAAIACATAIPLVIRWLRPATRSAGVLYTELTLALTLLIAGLLTVPQLVLDDGAASPVANWRAVVPWIVIAAGTVAAFALFRAERVDLVARYRRPVRVAVVALAVWCACIGLRALIPAGQGLRAQYYNGTEWAEPPLFNAADARPSTISIQDRQRQLPATFSVRWRGFLTIADEGAYTFATTSDDGSRLWIDGRLVVDNGGLHPAATVNGTDVPLSAGSHAVILEYTQAAADYALEWSVAAEGQLARPIRGWMLSQRRTSYTMGQVARGIDGVGRLAISALLFAAVWGVGVALRTRWSAWTVRAADVRNAPALTYIVLTVICVALAMGPPYGIWQYVYTWPGFSFIRAPLRFMVLGVLGVAVLAAVGFDRLSSRWSPRPRQWTALVFGALMAIEFYGAPLVAEPFAVKIPAADRWLDTQPTPFVVAEVPVGPERYQTTYMLHSTAHWQRTVAGYGGIRPPLNELLNQELRVFPDDNSLRRLREIGVTHVVVHIDFYAPQDWPPVEERLKAFEGTALTRKYEDATSRVYALTAR